MCGCAPRRRAGSERLPWDNYEYQGGDEPTILDQCNGHVGPAGDYHYHATASFPYILGCYTGTAINNGGTGMP